MIAAPVRARNNRLLNMLASVVVCAGLMIAYYLATGQQPIPPDSHVSFEHGSCQTPCPAYRIDMLADGTVIYQERGANGASESFRYHISKLAVRRVLRAFKRARFFDTDIEAYGAVQGAPKCYLTLTSGHMKTSVLDQCLARPEFAGPMQALARETHYTAFRDHDQAGMAAVRPERVAPPAR